MKNKLDKQVTVQDREAPSRPWVALACGAVVLWLFFTIYLLRLDQVIGMVVDDAWYVLLAKALAAGEGYQMINAPTPGIHPITPPVFPALLALCWLLSPDFPANLWLLKSVSIAARLGTGLVAFIYFKRGRELPLYLSLGIAAATVFYPPLVFHATSMVMSECVFMLLQLAAIVVIERGVRQDNSKNVMPHSPQRRGERGDFAEKKREKRVSWQFLRIPSAFSAPLRWRKLTRLTALLFSRYQGKTAAAWRYAALGGALASLAYLTRSAGAGLFAASILYLLKEHCPRQALIVGAIVALSVGSWIGYARAHAPSPTERAEQAGSILQPYHEQFWQRVAGNPSAGSITAGELLSRVWKNLSEISRVDMGAVPLYAFYRAIVPGQTVLLGRPTVWLSLALVALAIVGFITVARARITLAEFVVPLSLAISVLWGWEQFRFLLPLIPFLIFYQLMGARALLLLCQRQFAKPKPRVVWATLASLAWAMAALNVHANLSFIQQQHDPAPEARMQWHRDFEENAALFRYAGERLPKDAVLATYNPALTHLFTGRKTVALGEPAASWEMWKRTGVRYLVYASPNPLPPFEPIENSYPTIYRQRGRMNLRIVDLGPPSSRPAWGKNAAGVNPQ